MEVLLADAIRSWQMASFGVIIRYLYRLVVSPTHTWLTPFHGVSHCRFGPCSDSVDVLCCIDSPFEPTKHLYGVAQWLSRCEPLSICPSEARCQKLLLSIDSYADIEKETYGVAQWLSRCEPLSISFMFVLSCQSRWSWTFGNSILLTM